MRMRETEGEDIMNEVGEEVAGPGIKTSIQIQILCTTYTKLIQKLYRIIKKTTTTHSDHTLTSLLRCRDQQVSLNTMLSAMLK